MVLSGALASSGLQSAGGMVYRTGSDAAAQFRDAAQDATPRTPRTPTRAGWARMHPSPALRAAATARRRRRSLLSRLLIAALVVAALSGTTSYRMHMAEHGGGWEEDAGDDWGEADGSGRRGGGAFAGLRSWLAGPRGASRRSLREGPPGLDAMALATPRGPRPVASTDPGADAAGAHQFDRWWMIDGYAQVAAFQQEQLQLAEEEGSGVAALQQQAFGGSSGSGEGLVEEQEATPLKRLLTLRRLQPSAFRLYDFHEKNWVAHNVTRIPVEVPMARWAVASLLNKEKKKESIIFLLGGYAAPHEIAAHRPPRPPKTDAGGGVTLRTAGAGGDGAAACPLASTGSYSVNTGRSRFKVLPPLPDARYGGAAVIVGARLHMLGGWATPDRSLRLAQPVATHWSIGLNADGSSAPEWEEEQRLPAELVARRLTILVLSQEEDGEPGIYAWTDGSLDGASQGGGGEELCYAEPPPALATGPGRPIQLWSFAASTGWRMRGLLPQPLADDFQCAVAVSQHELVAVGSVERSGLFTQQRGLWLYDARSGGSWMRAGWAPVKFAGRLCALHHNRLFTSGGLPPFPEDSDGRDEPALDAAAAAEAEAAEGEQVEAVEAALAARMLAEASESEQAEAAALTAEVEAAAEELEAAGAAAGTVGWAVGGVGDDGSQGATYSEVADVAAEAAAEEVELAEERAEA